MCKKYVIVMWLYMRGVIGMCVEMTVSGIKAGVKCCCFLFAILEW